VGDGRPGAVSTATAPTPGDPFAAVMALQDLDTAIAQLRHRRAALPERQQLADAEARLAELAQVSARVTAARQALVDRQGDLEEHLSALVERRKAIEERLYAARGARGRDLEAMEAEVVQLAERERQVEDEELALMEEQEPLDARLVLLVSNRAELDQASSDLRGAVLVAEASVDTEITALEMSRQLAAAAVPPDLLSRYERLRQQLGGIGAARLVANRCSGCHLELPAVELDRIRHLPADAVVTCDQCGRILVRTPAPAS